MGLEVLKEVSLKKPYAFYFAIIFIVYFALNIFVNQLYVTGPTALFGFKLYFLIPFIFFLILVPGLVALNVNLVIHKFNEIRVMTKKRKAGLGSAGILGVFGGILGGACPGCFAGLFPAVIGLFGVSATLGSLPLYGLEIQAISSVFLIIGVYFLTKTTACKV